VSEVLETGIQEILRVISPETGRTEVINIMRRIRAE
jgi:hypothetical protein